MLSFVLPFVVVLIFFFGFWRLLDLAFDWIDRKCGEDFERRIDRYRK